MVSSFFSKKLNQWPEMIPADFTGLSHHVWIWHDLTMNIYIYMLVGGLEHEFYDFPYIGNCVIPTDEVIFFRRGRSTTNQNIYIYITSWCRKALASDRIQQIQRVIPTVNSLPILGHVSAWRYSIDVGQELSSGKKGLKSTNRGSSSKKYVSTNSQQTWWFTNIFPRYLVNLRCWEQPCIIWWLLVKDAAKTLMFIFCFSGSVWTCWSSH